MGIIVIQNPTSGYIIPKKGEILWYGLASNIPDGWSIVTYAENNFVMGCEVGQQTNTQNGGFSHTHTTPTNTGSAGAHRHTVTGWAGGAVGQTEHYRYPETYMTAAPEHGHGDGVSQTSENGAHTHTIPSIPSKAVYPPYKQYYWIICANEEPLPIGGIIIWDRSAVELDLAFDGQVKVCNGSNGTVDLRNRFVYGAAKDADVGADQVGSTTHDHPVSSTDSGGEHGHSNVNVSLGGSGGSKRASGYSQGVGVAGEHNHSVSGAITNQGTHTHTIKNVSSANHIPPYVVLYYVQRIL